MTQTGNEVLVPLRRNRFFLLLWSGQSVSLVGSQVTVVALPLVAALTLGAGAWEMGVLAACGRAPYLVFGLPAGVWVDRLPRRRVLIVCLLGQAAVLSLVPAAAALDVLTLTMLFGVAFAAGALAVFADIAALTLVPMVVQRGQLTSGQGALEASASASQLAGPALSGWFVQALTAPIAILADAVSFLVAAGTVSGVRVTERPRRDENAPSMVRQIIAGARAVFGPRLLRYVTLCTATHVFFFNAYLAVLVLYLARDLAMSPALLGLTLSAGAVGGLIGSVLGARIGRRFGLRKTMATAIVVAGLGSVPIIFAEDAAGLSIVIVVGSQTLLWFALQVYNVHQVPVRYALTDESLHGRVNATIRTAVWGTAPLGALAGGAVGALVGLRAALLFGGIGATMAALWLILTRVTTVRGVIN